MELTTDERRLLETYENGPRIWDAGSLAPTVWSLQDKGLIQPSGPGNANQLTTMGLDRLERKGVGVKTNDGMNGHTIEVDDDGVVQYLECKTCDDKLCDIEVGDDWVTLAEVVRMHVRKEVTK